MNNQEKKDERVLTPYTEKKAKEEFATHGVEEAGYKSPYVTDEPEPDKSEEPIRSPHTKPIPGNNEPKAEKPLSPHTTPTAYTPEPEKE